MQFLISPAESFKTLAKRANVLDAVFVVASVWVVLLGLQLADLAAVDLLTFTTTVWVVAEVTTAVIIGWFGIAGLAYLLQYAAGGKAEFVPVLVMTALAATPLALLGIAAVLVELLAAVAPLSDQAVYVMTRTLLWGGIILGSPGIYFGVGLFSLAKIQRSTAAMVAIFLTLALVLIVMVRNQVGLLL